MTDADSSTVVDVLFWLFAGGSVVAGWLVFRTDSMVRAAYWLLASFAGVGGILVLLGAEFLGLVVILMMAGEMTVMAFVMVMFMMNPAGLNPMFMVHQHRLAVAGGILAFLGVAAAGLSTAFASRPAPDADHTAALGVELLGPSMLVFETAGVALLATMIGVVVLASRRGRFGAADEDSQEPPLEPPTPTEGEAAASDAEADADDHGGQEHG